MAHQSCRNFARIGFAIEECTLAKAKPPRPCSAQETDVWWLEPFSVANLERPALRRPRLRKLELLGHRMKGWRGLNIMSLFQIVQPGTVSPACRGTERYLEMPR